MATLETDISISRQWLDLSLAQRAVWLDVNISNSPSAYVLVRWARIHGSFEVETARQALALVVARHDAMRLRVDHELPRQWMHLTSDVPFSELDVSTQDDPEQALQKHIEKTLSKRMPLGDQWLFSFDVVKLREREFYLLMRCHHLLVDEAGMSMFVSNWLEAFRALTSDSAPELALQSSYLPVITSDVSYMESSRYKTDLRYWLGRFKSLSPPLFETCEKSDLPAEGSVSATLHLDGPMYAELAALSEKNQVSPQRAVFALFGFVLGRRYGRSDITFGMALHRRDASNLHVVGMLAGMIPVKFRLCEGSTLLKIVREISDQIDKDLRHQRLPIDVLSRELRTSNAGLSLIFEVAFSFLPLERGRGEVHIEGLRCEMGMLASREASPLTIHASELPGQGGMQIDLVAHQDFLPLEELLRLVSLFQLAVQEFVSDAGSEAGAGITSDEYSQVIEEWNRTSASYPAGRAEEFFRQRVLSIPNETAVVSAVERLSYAELDVRSNQWAHWLVELGARPQSVIGVALERSVSTVVALLAILKAGCVYLPLDPSYPAERLAHMCADSQASLVITSRAMEGSLPGAVQKMLVEDEFWASQPLSALSGSYSSEDAAYIIYTSGSTGKPKGVAVPHSAAVNLAFARQGHDPVSTGDRILAAISVGFDVSIGQLLLPLLSGATIVIASDVRTMTAAEFWAFIQSYGVTHINSVPSFFESILEGAPVSSSLARLMLGGEPLPTALVRRLKQALPRTEVFNMYGPTEACIDATFYAATGLETVSVLPIGRPLPNYQAYILNDHLEPSGIGIAGDLYLGGAGLAHAYIHQAGLTAERFIAHPFRGAGERLYRTGDRARWRRDGEIEFLGRADSQVKIRGHRIELGEIEAALLLHPSISHAAVIARTDQSGGASLAAYIVLHAGMNKPDSSLLRSHLAIYIPEYMIPAAFVAMEALPLTVNGKLDAQALPPMAFVSERSYVAPKTDTEVVVCGLFAELLKLEQAGVYDHFFELGGHSLLAARLVSQLRSQWDISIPLRAVFEHPTAGALAQQIDSKTERGAQTFVSVARPEVIPLSFTQERLWFLSQLQKDDTYNVPMSVQLTGNLDIEKTTFALSEVVNRHEALRTRIRMQTGKPVQQIGAIDEFQIGLVDLSNVEKSGRWRVLHERLQHVAQTCFDLALDLPIKAEIISLSTDEHVVSAVIHHSVFDGWSADLFFKEFAQAYSGHPLPPLRLQYAEFALWQRETDFSDDISYWKHKLAGAPPYLDFPTDYPPPGLVRRPAGVCPLGIEARLYQSLQTIASANGASLFMLLHAAFASLLARWSSQTDIVLGTVVANRAYAEFEPIIGCFVNTLALRTQIGSSDSFIEILSRVKNDDLEAYEHQGVPFERVVEELQLERSLHQTPLFQVMLVLQSETPETVTLPGLQLEQLILAPGAAKFNLTLNLGPKDGALIGSLEYASDLYHASAMERFAGQFGQLLEYISADPHFLPMRTDLLNHVEYSQVIEEWNKTSASYPARRAEEFFRQRALSIPNETAVVSAVERLSYAELDVRSNQWAHWLVELGARPQSVIGVALERSVSTVVALLAILKAGCVYLPLDPSYPAERLAHMCADSQASLVITSRAMEGSLPGAVQKMLVEDEFWASQPLSALSGSYSSEDAAYIIYTSGSTGKPKGVAVPHSAAVNLAFARQGHDPVSTGDRILAAISVGFDVSIGQLLLPLLSGATIVIASDVRTMTAAEFWAFIQSYGVTHINSVPSFFESILEGAPVSSSLARLMLGGEPLPTALVRRLKQALPRTEVFNMYGPTEACIDATFYAATGLETVSVLPIGRPLPNYQAYILNDHLEPSGIGIAGDLYLGGAGLAHAYIHQAGLTAERFIAHPFRGAGERLYRTGDRARWRRDGEIEFLGRADSQVKIRGHRIELGEIEAALLLQAHLREAAVIVGEDQRLIAYYAASEATPVESLRLALSQTLPSYMVPAAYVQMKSLPLTSNGKLDRQTLPPPGPEAYVSRSFEPPQGKAEQQIAQIFASILKIEQVGRHDHFFELGGHSLLAMTLIDQMREAGLHVSVRDLFTSPTVAGLAAALTQSSELVEVPPNLIPAGSEVITPEMLPLVQLSQPEIDAIQAAVPGGAIHIQDIYPLAPLQEGILFHHLMSTTGDVYLTPFLLGFESRAGLDRFVSAMEDMVTRHDILRTAILWEQVSEPVQVVLREAIFLIEEVALERGDDAGTQLRAKFNPKQFRIDVRQAPLMRAYVAHDEPNNRWLLLLMSHHLILDHTSMAVILREVGLISSGQKNLLSKPAPFRNFVAQTRLAIPQGQHEEFFKTMLADVTETTAAFGLVQVQGEGAGIREFSVTMDKSVSQRLRIQARRSGVSPATLFHLAWALVLGHVSGRRDVVFGTLLLGRLQGGGSSGTLGLFINTLPLRIKIGMWSVEQALRYTHERLAELIRHESASLALAQRCSGVPAPAPLFSSLFNFRQSPPVTASVLPGVELVFAQERTDYPVAVAIDDHSDEFSITAQADGLVNPADLCRYIETATVGLLSALENEPSTPVHQVNILAPDQEVQITRGWNDTRANYAHSTIHEIFQQQAGWTPDSIAVTSAEQSLTYAALNEQAELLANALVARGVTPQTAVGVALPRSVSTIVAALAILKAGAIYLPLDPAYPRERLAHMIADSKAKLVITTDEMEALVLQVSPQRREIKADPNQAAYIIYTSGSTGKPKGVAVPHSAAVNLAFARQPHDPIGTGDRVLAAISVGFDVSIGQLLLPLLSGATVVIASDLRTLTPHEFWGFLEAHQVTHINSVPSFFESILDAAPPSVSLVRLMLGGEALTSSLVKRLRQALPATQVVNMYGPTEACIDATCYIARDSETGTALPIGKPLPNYRAYILNSFLSPVAVGVEGDLYLAGSGLAHGYLHQPGLTADRFMADPFAADGQRLYKTGDRARWRASGDIEFLGRADTQVKIRGHRIELGEIEAALLLHPSVAQAVITAQNRLVAYVVADAFDENAIRRHLAVHLPDYMIPALFITLPLLPLTPNGKVDIKALPQPSSERLSEVPYVAPGTETEIVMEKLWRSVLGVERIGIHDDFFALGGHSLAVMRLISLCNTEFGTSLALKSLFENPTISKLCDALGSRSASTSHPSLVPLRSNGTRAPLFCIHAAAGPVFRYVPLTNALNADQPVYGLQARALVEGQPLGLSIQDMASDYISAIRSVQPAGPYHFVGWSSGGMLAYEMSQQLTRAGEEIRLLALFDTAVPNPALVNPSDEQLVRAFANAMGYEDLLMEPKLASDRDELLNRIRDAGRMPPGIDLDQFRRLYEVFCNSLRIYPLYEPVPWQGSFVFFRALKRRDPMPDWSALVSKNATYIELNCTHFDFATEEWAPMLASYLEPYLEKGHDGTK